MSGLKDELMQAMIHHSPDDEDCVDELVCSKVEHLADAVSPVVASAVSAARAEVLAKVEELADEFTARARKAGSAARAREGLSDEQELYHYFTFTLGHANRLRSIVSYFGGVS